MLADQPRNRTVGCKMTDSEYERLAAVADPRQAPSMFNTIVMQGPVSSNPNTVKINGQTAPLCGFI